MLNVSQLLYLLIFLINLFYEMLNLFWNLFSRLLLLNLQQMLKLAS